MESVWFYGFPHPWGEIKMKESYFQTIDLIGDLWVIQSALIKDVF